MFSFGNSGHFFPMRCLVALGYEIFGFGVHLFPNPEFFRMNLVTN